MKKDTIEFDRVELSDFLCDAAADIDTCGKALSILAESIDDQPNEHCLLLLVIDKLDQVQHKLNEFELRRLR